MAQGYYEHQEDSDFCRRAARGAPLPVSRATRTEPPQQGIPDHSSAARAGQPVDSEGKSHGAIPRKRVPLACERCRKRKIKCSGDDGSGQACSNCKSSQTPHCLFVRVNSSLLDSSMINHKANYSSWPYPIIGSMGSSMAGAAHGSYDPQTTSRASHLSLYTNGQLSSYSKSHCGYDYGSGTQTTYISRNSYVPGCDFNYDEETTTYAMPSPAYMLPSNNTGATNPSYTGTPASPRLWNSASVSKAPPGELYSNQDSHPSLNGSGYSVMQQTQPHTTLSSDIPSVFPVMATLPSNASAPDRTLPAPTACRTHEGTASVSVADSASYAATESGLPLNNKSSKYLPMPEVNGKCRPPCEAAAGAVSSGSENGTKTTTSSPRDGVFGYIPISSTPPPATKVSSASFTMAEALGTTNSVQANDDQLLGRLYSDKSQQQQQSNSYAPEYYAHTTDKPKRSHNGNSCAADLLVNGQVYVPPPQTRPDTEYSLPAYCRPGFRTAVMNQYARRVYQ